MPFGPIFGRAVIDTPGDAAIVAAIRRAEAGSRGEVRVHLERRCPDTDPLDRARAVFAAKGMHETADGTGVLLYVALTPRVACVYAGEGIHEAAGAELWTEVVDLVARGFTEGRASTGLVEAIDRIGDVLRSTVPGDDRAGNELSDKVTTS